MTGYQNLHTHTTYCDGTLPPEAMIEAAQEKGCGSIGFSDHSYVPFDKVFSTPPDLAAQYASEINELKAKYEGSIEVFLGIEHDYYTTVPLEGLDYILGAVHYVETADGIVSIDSGARRQLDTVHRYFGGDFYAMTAAYFANIADIMGKADVDIIAHFDLVAKYNSSGNLFDETHPRYIEAALGAMDKILEGCKIFEVNTGAMYRLNKQQPYPSAFLLMELQKRGGEVTLSSDSHDAGSICYKFDEMTELLKACGFKHTKRLTKDGFIDIPL